MGSLQVAGVRFHLERVLNAAEVESLERALLEQDVRGNGQPFSSMLVELDDASLPYLEHVRRVIAQLTDTQLAQQERWRAQRITADQLLTQAQGLDRLQRRLGGERTHAAVLYLGSGSCADATEFPLLQLTVRPTPGTLVIWNLGDSVEHAQRARPRAMQGLGAERWELVTWVRELPCNEDATEAPTREIVRPK